MPLNGIFLSANHIAAQAGAFEPQRSNNALLFIDGLEDYGESGGQNYLTLSLDSFAIPRFTNEPIELGFLNQNRKVAGQQTFETMEVSYRDFVDVPTADILLAWKNEVCDPFTGLVGLAANYKKSARIELYGPDGSVSRKYVVEGIWPTTIDNGQIDMNGSDKLLIAVSFCIDKCYQDVGGGGLLESIISGITRKTSVRIGANIGGVRIGGTIGL